MGLRVYTAGVYFPADSKAADSGATSTMTGDPGWQRCLLPIPGAPQGATLLAALSHVSVEFPRTERELHQVVAWVKVDGRAEDALGRDCAVVYVRAGLRDRSGEWDDPYHANVAFSVLALDGAWRGKMVGLEVSEGAGRHPSGRTVSSLLGTAPPDYEWVSVLAGFDLRYSASNRQLRDLIVRLETPGTRSGAGDGTVSWSVRGMAGLRDSSGYWDDRYQASISACCMRLPPGSLRRTEGIHLHGLSAGPASETRCLGIQGRHGRTAVALSSFELQYLGGERPVRFIQVGAPCTSILTAAAPTPSDSTAPIDLLFSGGLRDNSGAWDDAYGAQVTAEVFGEGL